METNVFYQTHLNRVSRSFAFCIARLEGDFRLWVSMSYLLCRLLDTIEDAAWQDIRTQQLAFENFQKFVATEPHESAVLLWSQLFPLDISSGERQLLADAARIFADFHQLPDSIRNIIRRGVLNMSRGMRHFASAAELRLESLAQVNQYCFFVAGLVGEILTDLMGARAEVKPTVEVAAKKANFTLLAHHFGLFLQKINILKDQADDEKENRYLVPSRDLVVASLSQNAEGAFNYIRNIPVVAKDYRLFCAWCLFLGLASFPWIQKSWSLKVFEKIPRSVTEKLIQQIEQIIDDNEALESFFRDRFSQITKSESGPAAGDGSCLDLPWFHRLYEGSLTPEHLANLGMI